MAYTVNYLPQVEAALSSLKSPEENSVRATIRRLSELGMSTPGVDKLNDSIDNEPLYVLPAGNDLRVLFTAGLNKITVLDVLNRRFAERYG